MEKSDSHGNGTDFSRILEKRIRKHVRLNKLLKKWDKILVKDAVSEHFVRKIVGDMPVRIVKKGKARKIVGIWTADDEIDAFFKSIVGKKDKTDKRFIKIFTSVTDDELEEYCKTNNINFARRKKDKAIQELVESITKKHPDSKHKIIKSLERLDIL